MALFSHRLGRAAALIVASGFVAYAAGDGNLTVSVTDASGRALAGASVTITSPGQIGGARTVVTDAAGKARFLRLTPGAFRVQLSATGFQGQSINNVEVQVDQTASVNAKMAPVGGATVEVVAAAAQVDVTTVTAGTQIGQEEIENLPVARNQLATLNLAPGVVSVGGNPSLAVGLNRDNFGGNGSRNNTYLVDGIDVTSPEAGTSRTQIAPELIQVQDIKTGAITAEYTARAGLFSNVTTKVGSNDFSGGVAVGYQAASLNDKVKSGKFDIGERAIQDFSVWAMGPIIKDTLWYVISYQKVKDEVTVKLDSTATTTPGETRTGVNEDGYRIYGKLTWQITPSDTFSFTFNKNPYEFDNLSTTNVVTRRAAKTVQGGDRFLAHYSHQWAKFFLDVRLASHTEKNEALARYTDGGPQNTLRSLSSLTTLQSQLGNSSAYDKREYKKDQLRVDGTWLFEAMGSHTAKGGFQTGEESLTQEIGVGQGQALESYDLNSYAWSNLPAGNVRSQKVRITTAINNDAALKAAFVGAGYTPTDAGKFQPSDFNSYVFNEATPFGGFYSYRIAQESLAQSEPKMKTRGFYLQDQWQIGAFTFSPGFRVDNYKYLADNGQELFDTGNGFAPRIGVTWDVEGNGKSKAYAYFGRYIDPIKLDMVRFTGSLTSSVRNEQARMLNRWITFNVRGGSKVVDAVFADTFKLPKTDEIRLGYSREFATFYTFEATGTYRKDFDIVEDWDPTLYTDPNALEDEARAVFGLGTRTAVPYASLSTQGKRAVDAFRALVIDPNYFAGGGFSGAQNVARVAGGTLNFVLANLPGGERKYKSLDLTVTRREANHWGGFVSASFVDAQGNSFSSGNADFQGDLAVYDPRLPYTNGTLDGSVDWLFKSYGYYRWDMGMLVGATLNANSGYHYTRGQVGSGRVLQVAPALADFDKEGLGTYKTPTFYQLDIRVQYGKNFNKKVRGEVYLDILNATNRQNATGLSEGLNVRSNAPVPDTPYQYQAPRRFFIGARLKF